MNINLETIEKIAEKHGKAIEFTACEYAEPGYGNDGKTILFADWNDWPKHVLAYLDKHYVIEWSDQWETCHNCGKAYRVVGDSYGWKLYAFVDYKNAESICGDCVKENPKTYIDFLINNAGHCDTIGIKLSGFRKRNDNSHGWYGTCDDPYEIIAEIHNKRPDLEIVFGNYRPSQFQTEFSVFTRKAKVLA